MANKKASTKKKSTTNLKKASFKLNRQQKVVLGSFLMLLGLALFIAFISFLFNWQTDQSTLGEFGNREIVARNWMSKFGAIISDFFIYDGFGVAAFIFAALITMTGVYLFFAFKMKNLFKFWFWGVLMILWWSIFFGFFALKFPLLGGRVGFEINDYLTDYIGAIGTILLLTFLMIAYLVVRLKITPELIGNFVKSKKKEINEDFEQPTGRS